MALNIKDAETERLAGEVAALAGESKTRAVRVALEERRRHLITAGSRQQRETRLRRFLENEAWPQLPTKQRGRGITRAEREEILGYGPEGV
jgi:antitoxin VapB